jgi:hypothetical protein
MCPYNPCVPRSLTAVSESSGTWLRPITPPERGHPSETIMTASSPGKGVMSLLPGCSSGSLSRVRDPEVIKFFITSHSLSLHLTGYVVQAGLPKESLQVVCWWLGLALDTALSYPVFMTKPSTHHMCAQDHLFDTHGPKVFT